MASLHPLQINGEVTNSTGTTHSLASVTSNGFLRLNNASGVVVTLEQDSVDKIPVGGTVLVKNAGAGDASFVAGTGASISTTGNIIAAGASGLLIKTAANTWAVCVGGADTALAVPTDYLAWWSFDEAAGTSVLDRSGDFDGTLTDAALRTPSGVILRGLTTTLDDNITLATGSNIFGLTGDFTFGAFINRPDPGSVQLAAFNYVTSPTDGSNTGLRFYVSAATGNLSFSVRTGYASGYGGDTRGRWDTGLAVPVGELCLVFCQRTNTGASAYVITAAGVESATLNLGGTYPLTFSSTGNLLLAGTNDGSTPFWGDEDTLLDEMFLYNRVLTETERLTIWNGGAGKAPTPTA